MSDEKPFQIRVPEEKLEHLKARLALTTLPDELEESGRAYGAPLADIQRLLARWRNGYNWREHEAHLNNTLPQFSRMIDVKNHGQLSIHYVHKRSLRANAIPLLFVHGWPGSFLEVAKLLDPLNSPDDADHPAFHVVALSLPGFGFSDAPKKKGFSTTQFAEVCNKLMISLGYDQYVTQGGDWGFWITRKLASLHGHKHSKAWHTNYPLGEAPVASSSPLLYAKHLITPYTPLEQRGLERTQLFTREGQGYFHEQSTRPQTLGYSLADSPVGLLGWIYEKLVAWTDNYPWDDDEVLTWVSIYLFSAAGPAASVRIYYEVVQGGDRVIPLSEIPTIPMGASFFPKELRWSPLTWIRASSGNLVFTAEHDRGGHFAAHEQPLLLVGDLRTFYGRGGPAYGVVGGKSGYD